MALSHIFNHRYWHWRLVPNFYTSDGIWKKKKKVIELYKDQCFEPSRGICAQGRWFILFLLPSHGAYRWAELLSFILCESIFAMFKSDLWEWTLQAKGNVLCRQFNMHLGEKKFLYTNLKLLIDSYIQVFRQALKMVG